MELKNFKKTWLTLLSIVAVVFLVIGFVMIVVDSMYLGGIQYLITAIVYSTAAFLITKNKIKPNFSNPMFSLGFVFSIIGLTSALELSLHIGMWGFGIVLFIWGLFSNNKIKNDENA